MVPKAVGGAGIDRFVQGQNGEMTVLYKTFRGGLALGNGAGCVSGGFGDAGTSVSWAIPGSSESRDGSLM